MKIFKLLLVILFVLFISGNAQNTSANDGQIMNLNGTELFVQVKGKGDPVIVIHGGPVLDHSYLEPHFRTLAKNYRLIFFDQRLSGHSSADVDTADIRMEMFVEDIEALETALNLDTVHILAHSWGGLLGMKYALEYPSNIKSLILLNSMPHTSELWQKEQSLLARGTTTEDSLARQDILKSDLLKSNPADAIKKLLMLSFKNQFYNPGLADSLDLYVPDDYMTRSRLFGNLMPELADYNLNEDLTTLGMPVLIIYGSEEPASNLSGPLIDKSIKQSELIIIERSGHFPFIEQPQEFNSIVLSFLRKYSES